MGTADTVPSIAAASPATTATVACAHCALPVPPALVEKGAEHQFCCAGCRTVFDVIRANGLVAYYDVRAAAEAAGQPARTTGRSYAEFDDDAFRALYCADLPDGTRTTELYLEGVHCAACVWLVERAGRLAPGTLEVRLDVGRSRARVAWDPARVALSAIARVLDHLGYPVHPYRGIRADLERRRADRAALARLGITGAIAGNVMAIGFALYGGILHGIEPEYAALFRWASLVVTVPALLVGGSVFFRGAWAALVTRTLHMDVPIALGLLIAFGSGVVNTVRGSGPVYFDSVTALIFLLLAGRFVQGREQRAAADAAELLHSLAPRLARRIADDGTVREVPIEALLPGDRIEVRAGDTIPADGCVREGRSALDTALLTGESRPVEVAPGAPVHAGTVNQAARLVVEVTGTGEQTRVGRLARLVEDHARRRAPIVQLADRLSGVFVLAVLSLAAVNAALWSLRDPSRVVDNVVALLIVTCPCALGLATPLAVSAAIGRAARAGLLIKGADVVERLARPGRVWLDKTGTLTRGTLTLLDWWGDDDARRAAAALERESAHPLARAFVAAKGDGALPPASDVDETLGGGLVGRVEGEDVAVGSVAFLAARGIAPAGEAAERIAQALAAGHTPVVVALGGSVRAVAGFGDPVRPEAAAALEALRAHGWRVGLLSGDHPAIVAAVGASLGIPAEDCRGGVTPEGKLETVKEGLVHGPVVMVGDGVNDAAALSAATVGIGVHGGAEAGLAAADVYCARPGLGPLVALLRGSRRTLRVIRRNLVFSLGYNLVGVGLAMAGLIDPLVAALLMPASSLTVIVSSYRARTFEAEDVR